MDPVTNDDKILVDEKHEFYKNTVRVDKYGELYQAFG